jgi:hypothetical protein
MVFATHSALSRFKSGLQIQSERQTKWFILNGKNEYQLHQVFGENG